MYARSASSNMIQCQFVRQLSNCAYLFMRSIHLLVGRYGSICARLIQRLRDLATSQYQPDHCSILWPFRSTTPSYWSKIWRIECSPVYATRVRVYQGSSQVKADLHSLRGPAPIHWTILLDRKHTGVTLQTLHPEKIDHGTILAQTAPPGMPYPNEATTNEMIPFMATKGADLLIQGLKHRVFESTEAITHSETSILEMTDGKGIAHAPKITPKDRYISSWADMDAASLLRKHRAMGHLWDKTTWQRWRSEVQREFPAFKSRPVTPKRVVFSGGFSEYDTNSTESTTDSSDGSDTRSETQDLAAWGTKDKAHIQSVLNKNPSPGQLIFLPRETSSPKLLILLPNHKLLQVNSCTIDGGKKENGIRELWNERVKGQKALDRSQDHARKMENSVKSETDSKNSIEEVRDVSGKGREVESEMMKKME